MRSTSSSSAVVTLPAVTVVMPVRNEVAFIEATLASVFAQDYPKELLEIIVIDGCSDDGTPELVSDVAERAGREVKVLSNPDRHVPSALNKGIAEGEGSVIVRVDGHSELAPDYVRRCAERLVQDDRVGNVGGMWDTRGQGVLGQAVAAALSSPFGVGAGYRTGRTTPGRVDTVPFGAFRRDVLDAVGPFDEALVRNQDADYNLRIIQAGWDVYYDPEIRSTYHARSSLRALAKQFFGYGAYRVRTMRKSGVIATWRHLAPPLFVLGSLSVTLAPVLPVVLAAPVAYGLLATFFASRARVPLRSRLLVPLAFAVTHLAYGLGFWVGVFRFGPPPFRVGISRVEGARA